MLADEVYGALRSYINSTLVGMGALKGAPCQCIIATNADGTHTVTMKWEDDSGDQHTDSFTVLNGQVGSMEDISNVNVVSIQDGQVLAWDAATSKWVNTTNSATVASLANIGDVTFTNLADGQIITWDATAGKWKNKSLGTAAAANSTSSVTENSTDLLTSGGAYTALSDKADKGTSLDDYGITNAYTKTETDNKITTEIGKLDVSDSATAGQYVTAVSETDGKISVTREAADVTPTANSQKMLTSGGAKTALDGKVDKVTGKGLSENDFTTAYKNTLDAAVTSIAVNGAAQSITSGATDLDVENNLITDTTWASIEAILA